VLHVHPARKGDLVGSEDFRIEPELSVEEYSDGFGNHCGHVNCPVGVIRFLNDAIIRDPGTLDSYAPDAPQHDVRELPLETLSFLLPSRYCEVDSELLDFAWQTFGATSAGWARVQAICDFVHGHLRFDYLKARAKVVFGGKKQVSMFERKLQLFDFAEKPLAFRDFAEKPIVDCEALRQGGFRAKPRFFGRIKSLQHFPQKSSLSIIKATNTT